MAIILKMPELQWPLTRRELAGVAEAGAHVAGKPIVLVGFMGAGKSTAARRLGQTLGLDVIDVDNEIITETGMQIEQFFDRKGEAEFRKIEERLTLDAIKPGRVIATGGGAVLSEEVRKALRRSLCIYLDIPGDQAWSRVKDEGRPLARDRERFFSLHAKRQELYKSVARVTVPSQASQQVAKLAPLLGMITEGELTESARIAWAVTSHSEYPVVLDTGLLDRVGKLWGGRRAFIVSDSNTAPLYMERLTDQLEGRVLGSYVIEAGEESKTISTAVEILRMMVASGLDRLGCVIALGGGVVGDIAGFSASTYQRGVGIVHIPTTLVAQVDSAYGGKTGVDLPEAKNYVGTFHQPEAVYVDPNLLGTLPNRELSAGYTEVVKTALIAGGTLWERLLEGVEPEELVFECLCMKLEVVRRDELDMGLRAALNLGHTVGHAIEAVTGFKRYGHGEAVAVGLCAALELSERALGLDRGVRKLVTELLSSHGLASSCEGVTVDDLIAAMRYDKKRRVGASNWVLLASPGDVRVDQEVDDQDLREVLESIIKGGSK